MNMSSGDFMALFYLLEVPAGMLNPKAGIVSLSRYCLLEVPTGPSRSDVAVSIMCNSEKKNGENEFAEMEYMNITVVTLNEGGLHCGHV
ncbi:hypothetical protein V6N11_065758 [Hibiscus sabdariffa]|uniref:Uncharacterized protein n=1 Tax=Hibiscus sabdariffa TaxID=183260 RepID=A0ABR2PIA2_9ROSI